MKTLYIFTLLIASTLSMADSLYLSNNNVVTGTIVSMSEDIIKIETDNGILEVGKDKIVRGEFYGDGDEINGNLVFEFLFDGKIKDSSGSGYPIKSKSIPYREGVDGKKNGAIHSSGTGQYFYIENSNTISAIEEFTIAMNFFPEDTSENSFLISNWKNTNSKTGQAEGRFSLSIYKTTIAFYVVDSKGYYQSLFSKDKFNLKEWNSLAIRFSEGKMSLYVNGETVGENEISLGTLLKGNWPIYFMTAENGEDFEKYNFKGKLDKIKMFDSTLSDKELNLLYKL